MCWASREWALWPIFMLEVDVWRNQVPPVNCSVLGSGVSVRLQTVFPSCPLHC